MRKNIQKYRIPKINSLYERPIMKLKYLGTLAIALSLIVGCTSSYQEKKALKKLKTIYDPLIGYTQEEVILKVGAPTKIDQAGEILIFKYYKSLGMTHYMNHYDFGMSSGTSYEKYDHVDVLFTNGRVFSWNADVKR